MPQTAVTSRSTSAPTPTASRTPSTGSNGSSFMAADTTVCTSSNATILASCSAPTPATAATTPTTTGRANRWSPRSTGQTLPAIRR